MKEIYLAGGCFWGVEEYFSRIESVVDTEVGYANGHKENPRYEEVCMGNTGHTETTYVKYDEQKISLKELLAKFFNIIDPTSINKQGNDIGSQYRTGIYYTDNEDLETIKDFVDNEKKKYKKEIATEIMNLESFYKAEEYHQDYLKKNPGGYCHIDLNS